MENIQRIKNKLGRLWFLFVLMGFFRLYQVYPQIPLTVGTRFDGSGIANSWMSKSVFIGWSVGFVLFMNTLFLLIASPLIQKLKSKWINFPNKEHWLSSPALVAEMFMRVRLIGVMGGLFFASVNYFACEYVYQQNGIPTMFRMGSISFAVFLLVAVTVFGFSLFKVSFPEK